MSPTERSLQCNLCPTLLMWKCCLNKTASKVASTMRNIQLQPLFTALSSSSLLFRTAYGNASHFHHNSLTSSSLYLKEDDWLQNPMKLRDNLHFWILLEVAKMDEKDFRVETWANQLLWKVTNLYRFTNFWTVNLVSRKCSSDHGLLCHLLMDICIFHVTGYLKKISKNPQHLQPLMCSGFSLTESFSLTGSIAYSVFFASSVFSSITSAGLM